MFSGCYQNEVQDRGRAKALRTGLEFTITLVSWQNRGTSRVRTVQGGQESKRAPGQGREIAAGLGGGWPCVLKLAKIRAPWVRGSQAPPEWVVGVFSQGPSHPSPAEDRISGRPKRRGHRAIYIQMLGTHDSLSIL